MVPWYLQTDTSPHWVLVLELLAGSPDCHEHWQESFGCRVFLQAAWLFAFSDLPLDIFLFGFLHVAFQPASDLAGV